MELLILVPSEVEIQGLSLPEERFKITCCGVGLVAAAATTAQLVSLHHPDALLLLGVCGAYASSGLHIGDVLRVDHSILADFGVQDSEGHLLRAEGLGLGENKIPAPPLSQIPDSLSWLNRRLSSIPGVTSASVQCACGTEALAKTRAKFALIEEMEGAAVLSVASAFSIPTYHVRAVSNRAGRREPALWRIPEALDQLRQWLL
ncbi:MAG TPA: futalosine hydrolase [Fibrobacteraceae bacterium]|nr:futalosine hydrolase [Fibrobacteraceae bacterium]